MSGNRRRPKKYRAIVGDRSLDLEFRAGDFLIDGVARPCSVVRTHEFALSVIIDGRSFSTVVTPRADGHYVALVDGREFEVVIRDERALLLERFGMSSGGRTGVLEVRAPMPGLVLSLNVTEGQFVESGDGLVVLEAMKMENELRAISGGKVKSIHVTRGDAVGKNDLLVEIEA